jgi:mycothiol synthase
MIAHRHLQTEQDWWRVRNLLIETFPITGPGFNWELRRWEGDRFHREQFALDPTAYSDYEVWETSEGRLIGLALHEGDEINLMIHPDFRLEIEEQMIAFGESRFAKLNPDGQSQVHMTVYEWDAVRQRLLTGRGYMKMSYGWITRWLRLGNQSFSEPKIAPGYSMRVTNLPAKGEDHWADCRKMADLLNAAFSRPNFHQPQEYHNFMTQLPMFLNELNLVMVAPDGSFAAHAALNFDSANRFAIFEPVCTHPDHRQRGLAKALMMEGLRRVRRLGARIVEVSTGDADAANALYDSIGFTEYYKAYAWKKVW